MESKICSTCKLEKTRSEFYKDTRVGIKNDLRASCKECTSKSGIKYNEKNREAQRAWYRDYYQENKEEVSTKNREFRLNNKDWNRSYQAEYIRERRKKDPVFHFRSKVIQTIRSILKGNIHSGTKNRHIDIIGLAGQDLISYLHSTFEANYGIAREHINLKDVEIDHIIPLSTAKTIEDVKRLNHYTNLQLLFKEDNQTKGANLLDLSQNLL